MQTTTNYGLKKPERNEYISIEDLNENADKIDEELKKRVDSVGGDTADTLVSAFDASSDSFPVPVEKEKARTRWGKMKKFTEDFKNWMTGVCLIGQIVNNCVTNRADLPLSAAQGKVLMDLYTVLNTNSSKIGHMHDERYYTETEINTKLKSHFYGTVILDASANKKGYNYKLTIDNTYMITATKGLNDNETAVYIINTRNSMCVVTSLRIVSGISIATDNSTLTIGVYADAGITAELSCVKLS